MASSAGGQAPFGSANISAYSDSSKLFRQKISLSPPFSDAARRRRIGQSRSPSLNRPSEFRNPKSRAPNIRHCPANTNPVPAQSGNLTFRLNVAKQPPVLKRTPLPYFTIPQSGNPAASRFGSAATPIDPTHTPQSGSQQAVRIPNPAALSQSRSSANPRSRYGTTGRPPCAVGNGRRGATTACGLFSP